VPYSKYSESAEARERRWLSLLLAAGFLIMAILTGKNVVSKFDEIFETLAVGWDGLLAFWQLAQPGLLLAVSIQQLIFGLRSPR
jgi:hypothetical protein